LVHLSEDVRGRRINRLRRLIEGDALRHRLRLKAVQPVEEIHKHFQSLLLGDRRLLVQIRQFFPLTWTPLELEILLLECDGVVEEEIRSISEFIWDGIPREVPMEGAQDIGEHKGSVAGKRFREERGQSGQCIANGDARGGAIGEDENRGNGVDMVLDLSRNTPLVQLVLLNPACVGQPRRVEDTNLGKRLFLLTENTSAYHYSVFARKFIKVGRISLTLVIRTTSLVGVVENFEVVVINAIASKGVSDEL
jgi:hypothetical protein